MQGEEKAVTMPDLDILIVNETESEELLGSEVTPENGGQAALSLAELGPRTVVVTLGPAGAVVAHHGETRYFPAPRVTAVDTTGAGDSFTGAFAAELARGGDPFSAARQGVVAGSLATTKPGAYPSIPHHTEIEATLAGMHQGQG